MVGAGSVCGGYVGVVLDVPDHQNDLGLLSGYREKRGRVEGGWFYDLMT